MLNNTNMLYLTFLLTNCFSADAKIEFLSKSKAERVFELRPLLYRSEFAFL